MFRKLHLSAAAVLFVFAAYGQTIVSTTPDDKNVVMEEFTGINCVYCPDGHAIARAIQNANPDRVSIINIHQGGFATPTGSQPDFRTQWGDAIVNQSYSGSGFGYPSGTVNRHVFPGRSMASGGGSAMGRGSWTASANETLALPSYLNVAVEADLDVQTRVLTVHVEGYYTGDSPESTNKLNIALLQNDTKGPQTGGNAGNNYVHMQRLVDLLTGQWGEEISQTTQGTFVDRTFTYTIPADYRGVPALLEDMEIVAFITETNHEVISGNRTFPSFSGVAAANDIGIEEIEDIDDTCLDSVGPVVTIKNYGSDTLTSLNIDYEINGESHTHTWTGSLDTYRKEVVELPVVTYTVQETNTVNISIPNDEDNSNNEASTTFDKALEGTGDLEIEVRTDAWGYEFRWELRDSNDEIVERGSGYPNNQTTTTRVTVDADCYNFIIFDSYGDGGARVRVTDHLGTQLFFATGNWGSSRAGMFNSNGVLSVEDAVFEGVNIYPNPAQNVLNITNAENAQVQVFDILGKAILSQDITSTNEGIDVSRLQVGTYFLRIEIDGYVTTKKFIVSK